MPSRERAVLGQVATRLAHQPDGRAIDRLAAARAQHARRGIEKRHAGLSSPDREAQRARWKAASPNVSSAARARFM